MKTLFKIPALVTVLFFMVCCTNTPNKQTILLTENVTISIDTISPTTNNSNNDTCNIVWNFITINNEDINNYIFENTPFMIFSLDSTFALINTGCNFYIGECSFDYNNIKFGKIRIKDEICPIDALEREIVYMLESCNSYSIIDNNMILFKNDYPIGLLTIDTINSEIMPF